VFSLCVASCAAEGRKGPRERNRRLRSLELRSKSKRSTDDHGKWAKQCTTSRENSPGSAPASNGTDHRKAAGALLIEETNALVDAYVQILERTLTTYQGRIKPEEALSLLVTAYIQRSKLSFAA